MKLIIKIFLLIAGLLVIIGSFSSCTRTPEERRDRRTEKRYEKDKKRFAYLIKVHPEFIDTTTRIDTIIKHDTVNFFIPAKINREGIDSLLLLYCESLSDTNTVEPDSADTVVKPVQNPYKTRKEIIKRLIYAECTPEKIIGEGQKLLIHGKDTVIVNFKGTKDGLNLSIVSISRQINKNGILVTPCPEPNFLNLVREYFVGLLIAGFAILFLGFYLGARRRRNA